MGVLIVNGMITVFLIFFTLVVKYAPDGGKYYSGNVQISKSEFLGGATPVLVILWSICLIIWFYYFKKLIQDYKTKENGEICYGIVRNMKETGFKFNELKEIHIDCAVYIPSLECVKIFSEDVVGNINDYELNGCIKCKYFNEDINILGPESNDQMPIKLREKLDTYMENDKELINKGINLNDDENIYIDGKKVEKL